MLSTLEGKVSDSALATFRKAWAHSENLINTARAVVSESLSGALLDQENMCFAVVGSTARREAMTTSDIDLLPIWVGEPKHFPHFDDIAGKVREDLRRALKLEVSTSRDLMRSTQLEALRRADGIGGDLDHRRTLTQRMLILGESEELGGGFSIADVRLGILKAYVGEREVERTVSRHPLAVCNDIARYYRTLCVDYKSRAETRPESWAERSVKLRNARKLWYFSTLIAIAKKAADIPQTDHAALFDALAEIFAQPPLLRLVSAADTEPGLAQARLIVDDYAQYLETMGSRDVREMLSQIEFETREQKTLDDGRDNPWPTLHERAKHMSRAMVDMMLVSDEKVRTKVYDWFLL